MTDLPKFNFSGVSVKSEEELNAKLAESDTRSKYFRPGKHAVTINNVVYQGLAGDDRWGKFLLTLGGVGGKETTAQLIVPLRDVMYRTKAGKETAFMFKKMVGFMKALNVDLTIGNLEDTLKTWFSNPAKSLVGQELLIEIGYNGNHIRYDGKDTTGSAKYVIQMKDGSVVCDSDTVPMIFTTKDAALAHAETLQISIEEYSSVLGYEASPTAKRANVSGW
jgi:hypothetical protein